MTFTRPNGGAVVIQNARAAMLNATSTEDHDLLLMPK